MKLVFIGNCQTVTLAYYFQQLLDPIHHTIYWLNYGPEFNRHLGNWSDKTQNKIFDTKEMIAVIKNCDVIIYQVISLEKSFFANPEYLNSSVKNTCKFIKIPSIFLHENGDTSTLGLIEREIKNQVDIKVSDLMHKHRDKKLMLTWCHPTTFLFMEIIKIICGNLDLNFFTDEQYENYMKNENYMALP